MPASVSLLRLPSEACLYIPYRKWCRGVTGESQQWGWCPPWDGGERASSETGLVNMGEQPRAACLQFLLGSLHLHFEQMLVEDLPCAVLAPSWLRPFVTCLLTSRHRGKCLIHVFTVPPGHAYVFYRKLRHIEINLLGQGHTVGTRISTPRTVACFIASFHVNDSFTHSQMLKQSLLGARHTTEPWVKG